MKTATFEYGKQSLADWFAENKDCEKMILVGEVYCDLWDDRFKEEVDDKKGVYQMRWEINIGWHGFDLLYGFDLIAKDFHPVEFDITDLHLKDYTGEINDEDIPDDATEIQPSSILRMLVNRKHGTRFVYNDGFLTTPDGRVLIHCNVKDTVVVPNTIDTIGRLALAGIDEPKFEVVLPEGIVSIEEDAFDMSDGLVRINFPESLQSLGESAFCGTNLIDVILPDSIEEIPAYCFSWVPIENLHLPKNLKTIRTGAFVGLDCSGILLPEGVEVVESDSLVGQYVNIDVPKSIKELAHDFYYEDGIDPDPERHRPEIIMY